MQKLAERTATQNSFVGIPFHMDQGKLPFCELDSQANGLGQSAHSSGMDTKAANLKIRQNTDAN